MMLRDYDQTPDLFDRLDYDTQQAVKQPRSEYPGGLDFTPGGKLHDRIVKLVRDYADRGFDSNTPNIPEYNKVEHILDGYMPPDEIDRLRMADDSRKAVNVVTPMLVSHLAMFQTAMHRAFFSGDVFHRYMGRGTPERAAKAALAEKLMAVIAGWFQERRAADIHWGDALAYGRAYMWGKWSKKRRPAMVEEQADEYLAAALTEMGQPYAPGDAIRYMDEEIEDIREGTEWIPLDPYQVLTDGSTPPDRFQESTFFGWVVDTDALILLASEDDPEENLFNCQALEILARKHEATSQVYRKVESRNKRMDNNDDRWQGEQQNTHCHVIYMFCRLVPSRYGLGDSNKPEIWFFAVGGDKILISAERVRTLHGGMPVVCTAPNARGHHINPVSNLMINMGQQFAVDMLVKQDLDFQDIAKNGKFIFDPVMLEWRDFSVGGGPTAIRMKKRAMGKDISSFYHQIRVDPVTDGNWVKAANLIQMAREGGGINEPASDMPERPTAQGISAIEGRAISRMARIALIIDEQSRIPMAYQNLCNAAQWMSTEVILDVTGRDDELIRQGYNLPPGATGLIASAWDLDPDMDILPLHSMSQGPKNLPAMTEFAKVLMSVPGVSDGLMARFGPGVTDFLVSMFREMGVSDIDWYGRVNVTPMANEQVMQQVQAGNLVPMSEVSGSAPLGMPNRVPGISTAMGVSA